MVKTIQLEFEGLFSTEKRMLCISIRNSSRQVLHKKGMSVYYDNPTKHKRYT